MGLERGGGGSRRPETNVTRAPDARKKVPVVAAYTLLFQKHKQFLRIRVDTRLPFDTRN